MKTLAKKPFALVGVNGNAPDAKKLKEVMDKEKLNWRSFADRGAINTRWSAGTPSYYIIDHTGVIRYKWSGYPGVKAIDAGLETLIEAVGRDVKNKPN